MSKFDKLIMVVPRNKLFNGSAFEGFCSHKETDFSSRILENYDYKKRGPMEEDSNFKQPIGYCVLVNPFLKKLFLFQRSKKDEDYTEKRLQGKWSCGVGGHVDHEDSQEEDPLMASMLRELDEEVGIVGTPKVIGYINNDLSDVGKVHFGVLCIVETKEEDIVPNDSEIVNGRLRTIEEFEEILKHPDYDVEGWTEISLDPLKEYFKSL